MKNHRITALVAIVVAFASGQSTQPGGGSSASLSHPTSAETLQCKLYPDRVYRFEVTGVSNGISEKQMLLLWIEPVTPRSEIPGWYLQRAPWNGITSFDNTTGAWEGTGQIGNPRWPPHASDVLNVAVTVVEAKVAQKLLAEPGVVVRIRLPGTVADIARNVRVGL